MRTFIAGLVVTAVLASALAVQAGPPPAWDKKIPGQARFKVLRAFNDAAVLDKETGLVWEKTASLAGNWRTTLRFCALRNTGGRMGWRVPALEEILTLVDPAESTPALPDGAPFENLLSTFFWTANEEEGDSTLAVTVSLDVFMLSGSLKSASRKVLCVRGGRGSATPARAGL